MKKQISKLFFGLLLSLILFSCSFNDLLKNKNTTTVRIVTEQDRTMQDLVNSVDSFRIDVSGPGMDSISKQFTYGDTLVITIKVGNDRRFVLTALDSNGTEIFQGESTVNIALDIENTISITLAKLNGLMSFDLNGGTGVTLNSVEFEDIFSTGIPIIEIEGSISKPDSTYNRYWNSESDGTGSFSIYDTNEGALQFSSNNVDVTTAVDMQTGIVNSLNKQYLEVIWPTTSTTMYAQWDEVLYTITFDVTGNVYPSEVPNNITASASSMVELPKSTGLGGEGGETFGGWMTTPNGVGATFYNVEDLPQSIPMPSGGLTLYVNWIGGP